jgi:D-alanyl-D-alanine-carboxypeptidase/D-alanyl-D-alanine-endopeptidase
MQPQRFILSTITCTEDHRPTRKLGPLATAIVVISITAVTSCVRMPDPSRSYSPAMITKIWGDPAHPMHDTQYLEGLYRRIALEGQVADSASGWGGTSIAVSDERDGIICTEVGGNPSYRVSDTQRTYGLGSVGKTFMTTLVLGLVAAGEIELDTPIAIARPNDEQQLAPVGGGVTIRHLLTHRSGLPREPTAWAFRIRYATTFNTQGLNAYNYITNEYALDYLKSVEWPTATTNEYEYSNFGIGLLGYVVEQKMKRPLKELFEEYLFKPLNLKNTYLSYKDVPKSLLAQGHAGKFPTMMRNGSPISPWEFSTFMQPSAGMWSTAEDVLTLLSVWTGTSGTYLDEAVRLLPDDEEGWCSVWGCRNYQSNNSGVITKVYSKNGYGAGFFNTIYFTVKKKTAVVVLRNYMDDVDRVGLTILLGLVKEPAPEKI